MVDRSILFHEVAFNAVVLSFAVRHLVAGGLSAWVGWVYIAVALGSALTALPDLARPGLAPHRIRLGWYAVAMSIVFNAMRGTIGAISGPRRDDLLLGIDERVLGATPSAWLQSIQAPWVGEILAAAYMAFFAYLYGSCLLKLAGRPDVADRFYAALFTLYAVGFLCYSLVPAIGPYAAAAGLYNAPPAGGAIAGATIAVALRGTTGADVFPSLHVGVSLLILLFDRVYAPTLFRIALAPVGLLCVATLYLRFHYAVDVAAGAALAVACLAIADAAVPIRGTPAPISPASENPRHA